MGALRNVVMVSLVLGVLAAPALAANHSVIASSNKFTPSTISIAPGDTVTWTNSGGMHNITLDGDDTGEPNPANFTNWTVNKTFSTAGTFRYYCEVHGGPNGIGMAGTVVVGEAGPTPLPITEPPNDQGVVSFAVTLRLAKLGANSGGTLFNFAGDASPAAPGAQAQIQLRGREGKFKTVATTSLKGNTSDRSTYAKKLRIKKTGVYRVRVPKVGEVRTGLSPKRRATVR